MATFIEGLLDYLNTNTTVYNIAVFVLLFIAALLVKLILRFIFIPIIKKLTKRTHNDWDDLLFSMGFFKHLSWLITVLVFLVMARTWMDKECFLYSLIIPTSELLLVAFILGASFAFINTVREITKKKFSNTPLLLLFQVAKITFACIAVIIAFSIISDKSPALIVSGLGAMTAILMLVFKDPIVGFAAGIQLSINKMLAVGDWLEMPKYNADGSVIEISLTTVKVQNWDKTITTIPTSSLVSESFKNWKGMVESGGRRIKRAFFIDAATVKILEEQEIARLKKLHLITAYLREKEEEIKDYNQAHKIDGSMLANGRQLTNIGTFRAYIDLYIKQHPGVNKEMLAMVRQLQSTPEGIPMEVYCFTSSTAWIQYEGTQADIFDHIFAVAPTFGLRVFQSTGSADIKVAAEILAAALNKQ